MFRCAVLVAASLVGLVFAAAPGAAVVGGDAAVAADYPWLAAVGSPAFVVRPGGHFCGGVLITPDKVLTAAHCVSLEEPVPFAIDVTFGRTDLRESTGNTVSVSSIRIHPDFGELDAAGDTAYHNDLALLTLDHPVAGPVLQIAAAHGDSATVVGWGVTAPGDWSNSALHAATVPLLPDSACARAYGPAYDARIMLCAGSTPADTAEFDSGGPILVDGKAIGLTSWGRGSAQAGYPGVYTRLSTIDF
ncbi:serine protease [Nocardia panacis]|uniref:Serine protease n=1 Tax=Nocardia panacis TaxID=2340916 RepID=A0A3A4JRH1_9NOCA|nr:serine protease [Nocardia panacis]RJO68251.1 serine protease [Nocardia panacis]